MKEGCRFQSLQARVCEGGARKFVEDVLSKVIEGMAAEVGDPAMRLSETERSRNVV